MNDQNKNPFPDSPAALRKVPASDIPALAEEIRAFLVRHVTESGGHLASNLGVVELTLAIHRAFMTPEDRIVWDVGHQSYVHKLLTGRAEDFQTLRVPGGLSGFTRRDESLYDPFGAGHSSTALSAAIGLARADRLQGRDNVTVAVIGDGAFFGGMTQEALNNCSPDLPLVAILNENEMSIGRTTGPFARYLTRMRSTSSWYKLKRRTARFLLKIPLIGKPLHHGLLRLKIFFKNLIYGSNLFEDLGFFYMGPFDGHDEETLERALREARLRHCPVLVHVKTRKGKGYPPAEQDPSAFHSVYPHTPSGETPGKAVGEILTDMAQKDEKIVAITAAMTAGTGLEKFASALPERFFDVGIAEEHAVTFAAGLAAGGIKPFTALYSTFFQRSYDQILHDAALQHLPVRLCIDRAGLSPADGPTHHGIFDVAMLSQFPDVTVYTPIEKEGIRLSLTKMAENESNPSVIRYASTPSSPEVLSAFYPAGHPEDVFFPRSDLPHPENAQAVIVTYGRIAEEALGAARILRQKGIGAAVVLLEQLTPYRDTARTLLPLLPDAGVVAFLEEGILAGGAAVCMGQALSALRPEIPARYLPVAIADPFAVPPSPTDDLRAFFGISAEQVADLIDRKMNAR